jgi:phosphate starvation-inducible PhoH-like protein
VSSRRRRESREERSNKKRVVRTPVEVLAKTDGQAHYIKCIEDSDIIVCDGKAGTGKTLIAVGMAIKLLKDYPETYNRIIMVRPAVSVQGEDLGFLPGGIDEKMHPFMIPMLDSMRYFLDEGAIQSMMGAGSVEIIPVAFIRGRTLNNTVVIFDEAQNSTPLQMKTFLTRMGFNTKAIVEGDISQSDLGGEAKHHNGLQDAMKRLDGVEGVSVVRLTADDVVRSPIVARILKRYDE